MVINIEDKVNEEINQKRVIKKLSLRMKISLSRDSGLAEPAAKKQ